VDTSINELNSPGEHYGNANPRVEWSYDRDQLAVVVERLDWIACALSGGHDLPVVINTPGYGVCRRCGYHTRRRTH
jgi:hypothetical protein